jgi:hypothetical protein
MNEMMRLNHMVDFFPVSWAMGSTAGMMSGEHDVAGKGKSFIINTLSVL